MLSTREGHVLDSGEHCRRRPRRGADSRLRVRRRPARPVGRHSAGLITAVRPPLGSGEQRVRDAMHRRGCQFDERDFGNDRPEPAGARGRRRLGKRLTGERRHNRRVRGLRAVTRPASGLADNSSGSRMLLQFRKVNRRSRRLRALHRRPGSAAGGCGRPERITTWSRRITI